MRKIRCILEKALLLLILEKMHSGDILEKAFTQHVLEKIDYAACLGKGFTGLHHGRKKEQFSCSFSQKILIFLF